MDERKGRERAEYVALADFLDCLVQERIKSPETNLRVGEKIFRATICCEMLARRWFDRTDRTDV